ncbi:hypothetical protein Tco_0831215 [Tanacetum coccineum]
MGELTFFLGLQVKQQPNGIFISQDKYVVDILKKFDYWSIRTATTPIESNKPLVKDEDGEDIDVHVYRSMIGSLMYLTASRPDIMFAMDSPFELEAFSDSDYGGASLDRKSTIGACQFHGRRLISLKCKKQTIVTNSTTKAEYVAAANCYGQVLWIQNQMMDYGFNFMNTKIHIDNESTISVIKNPVAHSRTKHIEIRFHFIRDCYEKRLIEVIKIHTDSNVADLLTKGFDVTRFNFLVVSGGESWTTRLAKKTSLKKKGVQKEYISKQGRESVKSSKGEPYVHKDLAFDDLDDDAMDYYRGKRDRSKMRLRTSSVGAKREESTNKQYRGTGSTKDSTDRQGKGTADQNEGKSATQTAPTTTSTPTPTIFGMIECGQKVQEEWEEAEEKRKAKFLHDTIAAQMKFLAQQRSKAIRNKPPIRNQLRNQMMTYLKHVGGKKHSDLKTKTFEEIQVLYERGKIKTLLLLDLLRMRDRAEVQRKKRKSGHVKMLARKRPRPQPDDDSDDEHRKCLRIVTFNSTIDSEIMETKSFIARLHKNVDLGLEVEEESTAALQLGFLKSLAHSFELACPGSTSSGLGEYSFRGACEKSATVLLTANTWQCKKQTIVANSTTEAEYVAAANCCGQVLWIQNQMMDYGFNFMNTKIYIDNDSTISVIKNPVAHSRTKHIEIHFHFIRDYYEKRLIEVIKIHTDSNVADLLTKGFNVTRFNFLVVSIGLLNL